MSTVNVHIVTFNSEAFIGECIQAVLRQTARIVRIVVIDNASTDGTRDILRSIEARNPEIKVIYNERNVGFAGAHNQALRQCETDYFLVLNPDVVLGGDYIRHLLEFMDRHHDVGSTTGLLVRPSPMQEIDSAGVGITKARRAFDRTSLRPENLLLEPEEVFGVSGAAAVYRRQMALEISVQAQFFDESFFAYKEDVDVAWRSCLSGWKAYCVPRVRAGHNRGWQSGDRQRQPRWIRQFSYINRYRMMFKNEQWSYLLRHAWCILPYELAALTYVLLVEPFLLQAWLRLWADRRSLRSSRESVRRMRRAPWWDVYRYFGER